MPQGSPFIIIVLPLLDTTLDPISGFTAFNQYQSKFVVTTEVVTKNMRKRTTEVVTTNMRKRTTEVVTTNMRYFTIYGRLIGFTY
ncbi:MAG: hypothetical protein ACRC8Y_13835 [Chroococcales cyanobacterium]